MKNRQSLIRRKQGRRHARHRGQFERFENRYLLTELCGNLTKDESYDGDVEITCPTHILSGVNVTFDSGASAVIRDDASLTIDGTLNLIQDAKLTLVDDSDAGSTWISVSASGIVRATAATITGSGGFTRIIVNSGGKFQAIDSTISVGRVEFDPASELAEGDLTNNVFHNSLRLSGGQVPLVEENVKFQTIEILEGTLSEDVTWRRMGTADPDGLTYSILSNLTVARDATLTLAENTNVQVVDTQSTTGITLDGTLKVETNAQLTLIDDSDSGSTGIWVNASGIVQVTNASISGSGNGFTSVSVNAGGKFQAKDSTISVSRLEFDPASELTEGDLTNNVFNNSLRLSGGQVPLVEENIKFQTIEILEGTLTDDVTWRRMGTADPDGLTYFILSNLTVARDATLTLAENTNVQVMDTQSTSGITLDGTLKVKTDAQLTLIDDSDSGSTGIWVNDSGTVQVTNASITGSGNGFTSVLVNAGGTFQAKDSTISVSRLEFDPASELTDGDLTNNVFNNPLRLSGGQVPLVEENVKFQTIEILEGTLSEDVTWRRMGTADPDGLTYSILSNLTVARDATLTLAENTNVQVMDTQSTTGITVDGILKVEPDAQLTLIDDTDAGSTWIWVNESGVVQVTSASIAGAGSGTTGVFVNPGANIQASDSKFSTSVISMQPESIAKLHLNRVSSRIDIAGNAVTEITNNDFQNATIQRIGDSDRFVDLKQNWWGTGAKDAIAARIPDRVEFEPFLTQPPTAPDLARDRLDAPPVMSPGGTARIDFTVKNLSKRYDAPQTGTLFYLNTGPSLEGAVYLGVASTPPIAANSSSAIQSVDLYLPSQDHPVWSEHPIESLSIFMLVDALAQVVEWDENNNNSIVPASLSAAVIGDSNSDGIFNSSDLVTVFQAGEYEDGIDGNSTWAEGDWNGDGDFDSQDFIFAFQAGTYVNAAVGDVASRIDSSNRRVDHVWETSDLVEVEMLPTRLNRNLIDLAFTEL